MISVKFHSCWNYRDSSYCMYSTLYTVCALNRITRVKFNKKITFIDFCQESLRTYGTKLLLIISIILVVQSIKPENDLIKY